MFFKSSWALVATAVSFMGRLQFSCGSRNLHSDTH